MYPRIIPVIKNKSYFLFGPRGTGKTLWIRNNYKDSLYISLLEQRKYQQLLRNPDQLAELILDEHSAKPVIIDEVQKLPALLDVVHHLIEDRKINFILTGSSARKLYRTKANLLAGRARRYEMHPLTAEELGSDFDVQHSLKFGQLPSVYVVDDPKEYLESYVGTYIQEEVQGESLVRNLQAFTRFLEIATFSQASVLSVQNVAQECSVDRNTAESYFQILEDLLLAIRLPVFSKKAKRKLITHRKFYYFDVGVFRTLRPTGPLDSDSDINGAALETLILQELRAHNSYLNHPFEISFWRTTDKKEVDFILYGDKGLVAIEVKCSSRIKSEDLTGLIEFKKDYPMAKCFLVYTGSDERNLNGITLVPVKKFLPEIKKRIF